MTLSCAGEYHHKTVAAQLDKNGTIFNCFVGIGMRSRVQYFGLTYNDFAPSDLAIKMPYILIHLKQNSYLEHLSRLN